ncbi:membrane protein insertase YidC [bacterium]|nr:membrane protein insertase YidC [bacterium]
MPLHTPHQGPDLKNMVIALVLSMLLICAWNYFYPPAKPQPAPALTSTAQLADGQPIAHGEPAPQAPAPIMTRDESLKGTRIHIDNGRLHGSFAATGKGLRFDDLTLVDYRQTLAPDSPEVVLLSPSNTAEPYFAEFGWLNGKGITTPGADAAWQADGEVLSPKTPVTLSWKSPEGAIFSVRVEVDENYMFTITRRVENAGQTAAELTPYALVNRYRDMKDKSNYASHEGVLGVFNGTLDEITYHSLVDEKDPITWQSTPSSGEHKGSGWAAMGDKYWVTAVIPAQDEGFNATTRHYTRPGTNGVDAPRFQLDLTEAPVSLKPGEKQDTVVHFYAGAKEVKLLDRYTQALQIPLFDRAVDFGRLYFLTKPIFQFLQYIYSKVGNFGISILLLTVVIRTLVFPLANKSYKSLAHMREIQPKMAELREKYADDKLKLNQEMMALYQREKVNPMAGCLPILLQIPIFFALYKVLTVSIEMRHAPFFGWIHDLSAPDPTTVFNLFGLIPWNPPAALMIGAWPIIMATTMFIQQRLQPAPNDPVQAKIMKFFPLMFLAIFAHFAAGLVIYWSWSNTLSILQQAIIMRRHGHHRKHKKQPEQEVISPAKPKHKKHKKGAH